MIIAAKCAPEEKILKDIERAGLSAVELYISIEYLHKLNNIKQVCRRFPFRYAIHAPTDGYEPELLSELVDASKAEIVVFHDIYWEDEWKYITEKFKPLKCKLCIENVFSAIEPVKYMRRFGLGRCLDLEHLVMEVNGIFEEPFIGLIKEGLHIHMTGYTYGSKAWHTPIHHAPEQSIYLLNMLKQAGYSGLVVSEAQKIYQTREEFRALYDFFQRWKDGSL
jgi:hypothetical protein